jgi:hypothetical protein
MLEEVADLKQQSQYGGGPKDQIEVEQRLA